MTETSNLMKTGQLPELIICSNGDILKKRRCMKVPKFPNYPVGSRKHKYSKILMLYPLLPGQDINEDQIDDLYNKTDESTPHDKNGKQLTIIENNER